MSFHPNQIEKKHVQQAIEKIEAENIELIPSTRWLVEINGKKYPPKEVMRYAREQYDGLDGWKYGGGPPTNKYLERMGFSIIDMAKNYNPVLDMIKKYKTHIEKEGLENELYKWQLVEEYKGRPNLAASNFSEEIKSLQFSNLIYQYAITSMRDLADRCEVEYRELLRMLFDEKNDLKQRIQKFDSETEKLFNSIVPEENISHHQDERTISAFLTFRFPEKYTFYKDSYYKKLCQLLNLKPKSKGDKYVHYMELINDLVEDYISEDEELLTQVSNLLPKEAFSDENHLILAQDILYNVLEKKIGMERRYWRIGTSADEKSYWEVMKTNGTISIGWSNLGDLDQLNIRDRNQIIKAFQQNKIEFSNAQTQSRKAGEIYDFYQNLNIGDVVLAQSGIKILAMGIVTDGYNYNEEEDFSHEKLVDWKVFDPPFENRNGPNTTCYELTDPALISKIDHYLSDPSKADTKISKLSGMKEKKLNRILYGPPGTGKTYKLQDEYFEKFTVSETSLSKEQYLENMVADLTWWQTFAAALKDSGRVSTSKLLEHPLVKAKERLSSAKNIKPIAWSRLQAHTIQDCPHVKVQVRSDPQIFYKEENSDWRVDFEALQALYPEAEDLINQANNYQPSEAKKIRNYDFITFHQSFSYEDFVEGIKPKMETDNSDITYEISPGIFKKLVNKAKANLDQKFALFIDEINRGNVSAIFGELITLIEEDKRMGEENEISVKLPYSKEDFVVPSNLYIIGTMNTADRSVEALDSALRRRFVFEEIMPQPKLLKDITFDGFNLGELLRTINERIEALLDRDHCIGHSYFIKLQKGDTEGLKSVFENKIIPLLQEYFYHDYEKIALILGEGFIERKEGKVSFAKFSKIDSPEILPSYHLKEVPDIESAVLTLLNRSNEAGE